MATDAVEEPDLGADATGWSLVKGFDAVAAVIAAAVVVRAIGGIISALGLPSINLGASYGPVASVETNIAYPLVYRLQIGTQWADLITGLMLLASVALMVLPRRLWDVEADDRGLDAAPAALAGIGILAVLSSIACGVGIGNAISHSSEYPSATVSATVANETAALAMMVLAGLIAWRSRYLVTGEP